MEKETKEIETKKIQFSELSGWLKFAIVVSWIIGAIYIIGFALGFIEGLIA